MRARNIKPAFFKSDVLGDCSPLARLLFQGLWCLADHEGRLHYRPRRIKAEVLPYDDADVGALLRELLAADPEDPLVRAYGGTADKPEYLWIPKFRVHQSPTQRERAKASAIPPFPEGASENESPDRTEDDPSSIPVRSRDRTGSADIRITDVLIPDSVSPDTGGVEGADHPAPTSKSAPGEAVMAQWNEVAAAAGLVPCKTMGKKRRQALGRRWRDPFWRAHYLEALERARRIRWLRGNTGRHWKADIDWFLRPDTVTKLVEGGYDDNIQRVGAGRTGDRNPF